jgi:hypothetical protein
VAQLASRAHQHALRSAGAWKSYPARQLETGHQPSAVRTSRRSQSVQLHRSQVKAAELFREMARAQAGHEETATRQMSWQ